MARERQEYIQQRAGQITDQILEAFAQPTVRLKAKRSYVSDRLRTLCMPPYDNHLFRQLLSDVADADNYDAEDSDDDDDDEDEGKAKYFINGNLFKKDIEAFAKHLAGAEYDKRAKSEADAEYDGLKDFLSVFDTARHEVERSDKANSKSYASLKPEIEAYVREHEPQMKGELLARLAPGGKLMLTEGWAAGLEPAKVKTFLKNAKAAIDSYAKKASEAKHKADGIKKACDAIDKAMKAGAEGKFEIKGFDDIFDAFIKDAATLECKLGMQLVSGKQQHFVTWFDLKAKTAQADCDALGWQEGNISREAYVEWKANMYRYSLLKAISGTDIHARKGLAYRLSRLRKLQDGVYAHESWGKLLDAFSKAQYRDYRYNKGGQMLQQAAMDEELSAALDAFLKEATGSEYDLRKADAAKSSTKVLDKCIAEAGDADEDFKEHEIDVISGKIFSKKKAEAGAYTKDRAPAVKEEFGKRFGELFHKDLTGGDAALPEAKKQQYAQFAKKLSMLQEGLSPVSASFDKRWSEACAKLTRACERLSKGEKLADIDAQDVLEKYDQMMDMLAGYEYWQKELSMGIASPDICAIVVAAFGDEGYGDKEDESIRQQTEKYRDANYDRSELKEEEEYLNRSKKGIVDTQKRNSLVTALRDILSYEDIIIDGTKPKTELVFEAQRTIGRLFSLYRDRLTDVDNQQEKLIAIATDIDKLSRLLSRKVNADEESIRNEEDYQRVFGETLEALAGHLVDLDDAIESEDIKEDHEDSEENENRKPQPLNSEKILSDLSSISESIMEDVENLRTIELAIDMIFDMADAEGEAVRQVMQILNIGDASIGMMIHLNNGDGEPDVLRQTLKNVVIDHVKYGGLEEEFHRSHGEGATTKFISVTSQQICELAETYMYRFREPDRLRVGGRKDYDVAEKDWKERRRSLSEKYAESRELEALVALEQGFGGIEAEWKAKAYSEDIVDKTKNDPTFNAMERAYEQFRGIAKVLHQKRARTEPFTKEDLALFKADRQALLQTVEAYLQGLGQAEGDALLQGRRELASLIQKQLRPLSLNALEASLLMPKQPEGEPQREKAGEQEAVAMPEAGEGGQRQNDGFVEADFRSFLQKNSNRVNQYMNFFMQRYGITKNEIDLMLGKGAPKGRETSQALTVIYDILARNHIPEDFIPESRIMDFANKTCKKIRENMKNKSTMPENRMLFAEAMAGLFSVSEFDVDRDYVEQPLTDQEKSGYHAKMTLQNYFYFLDNDNYNPDAWYKSGKISDLIGAWANKRHAGANKEERIAALTKKINEKWWFGEELSKVLAGQLDKEFSATEEESGLDAESEDYEKDMGQKAKHKYITSLYMFRNVVDRIPSKAFSDFNIELPKEIHNNALSSPFSSFALKVDYRPAATEESLDSLAAMIRANDGENAEATVNMLNNVKILLQNVDAFDLNFSMLETKKHFRLFNWNSSEYNHCQSALGRLKFKRDELLRALADLPQAEGAQADPRLLAGVVSMIGELNDSQKTCVEAVQAYNNKVFAEDVRGKTQAAGMARFAGVQGLASLLRDADGELLSQKETFRAQDEAGREQMQQFRSAYQNEQEQRQAFGKDAVHRSAASKAKDTLRRQH